MTYHGRARDGLLRRWADDPGRKPLVLRGARQTGKSPAARELGRSFDLCVEVDFLVPLAGRPCPIEVRAGAA